MPIRDNNYKNEELWVTKDMEVIAVGDMNEHHARNTLRMLIRQIRKGDLSRLGRHKDAINCARAVVEAQLC